MFFDFTDSCGAEFEYSDLFAGKDDFWFFWESVDSFLCYSFQRWEVGLWESSVDVCGDIGIGIANGGGTISDMFYPSERAYVSFSFPIKLAPDLGVFCTEVYLGGIC